MRNLNYVGIYLYTYVCRLYWYQSMSIFFNNKIDIKSLNLIKNELFKNCLVYLGFDYEQQIVKPEQTNKQRDREFNYRGHSYPLWIVWVSRPIYYGRYSCQIWFTNRFEAHPSQKVLITGKLVLSRHISKIWTKLLVQ